MPHNIDSALSRFMRRYWPASFVIMMLSFLGFGASSINLAQTFLGTLQLIGEHGAIALFDGALMQLIELLITSAFAVMFYVIFKTCESILVQRLLSGKDGA